MSKIMYFWHVILFGLDIIQSNEKIVWSLPGAIERELKFCHSIKLIHENVFPCIRMFRIKLNRWKN